MSPCVVARAPTPPRERAFEGCRSVGPPCVASISVTGSSSTARRLSRPVRARRRPSRSRNLEAISAVDDRVTGDDGAMAPDPQDEIGIHPEKRLDTDGQLLAGREQLPARDEPPLRERARTRRPRSARPGSVYPARATGRSARSPSRVARAPRTRGRWGKRIEQQETFAVVDRVGRDQLVPLLTRLPVRMRCLPVPDAGLQLLHAAMLSRGRRR